MMRNFYTVVLERMARFRTDFATEPYEVGWASEAIFFVKIHELKGEQACVTARAQVSVDGIEWIDESPQLIKADQEGSYFLRASHFGGWLRLRNELSGKDPAVRVTIQLVLKE